MPNLRKVHFNFSQETPLLSQQSNNQLDIDTAKLRKTLEQLERIEREYFEKLREQAEDNIKQLHAARSHCKYLRQSGVSLILNIRYKTASIYFWLFLIFFSKFSAQNLSNLMDANAINDNPTAAYAPRNPTANRLLIMSFSITPSGRLKVTKRFRKNTRAIFPESVQRNYTECIAHRLRKAFFPFKHNNFLKILLPNWNFLKMIFHSMNSNIFPIANAFFYSGKKISTRQMKKKFLYLSCVTKSNKANCVFRWKRCFLYSNIILFYWANQMAKCKYSANEEYELSSYCDVTPIGSVPNMVCLRKSRISSAQMPAYWQLSLE